MTKYIWKTKQNKKKNKKKLKQNQQKEETPIKLFNKKPKAKTTKKQKVKVTKKLKKEKVKCAGFIMVETTYTNMYTCSLSFPIHSYTNTYIYTLTLSSRDKLIVGTYILHMYGYAR